MVFEGRRNFWREAFAWQGSVTPLVIPYVLAFGLANGLDAFSQRAMGILTDFVR